MLDATTIKSIYDEVRSSYGEKGSALNVFPVVTMSNKTYVTKLQNNQYVLHIERAAVENPEDTRRAIDSGLADIIYLEAHKSAA